MYRFTHTITGAITQAGAYIGTVHFLHNINPVGSSFPDAPEDSKIYGRENGEWVEVEVTTNDKGFYLTEAALIIAFPVGQSGWFATVGATDTIWVWDVDTLSWVDSGGGSSATNLGYTASPTNGIVTSDTGNDATIPAADGTNAGLLLPAEKTKITATSGTNTGDQDISAMTHSNRSALDLVSGTNTGDQTAQTTPVTPPTGYASIELQGLANELGVQIDGWDHIHFRAISPDFWSITRPYAFTIPVGGVTNTDGVSTITTSTDAAYVLGATVTAGDYLKVTGSVINMRSSIKVNRV